MVGEDTVALKGTGACVVFGDRFCVVAVVLFVAGNVGSVFCGRVIIFAGGVIVSIFGGGELIFGFSVGGPISGGGIWTIDGSTSIFCGSVSLFEVVPAVLQATPVVFERFWLNGDFASPVMAVSGVLLPSCDVTHGGVTFNKSLLTSSGDCDSC